MNLRVPRITHTGLSYDKALLPEARVTGLILNDIRKVVPGGLLPPWTPIFVKVSIFSYQILTLTKIGVQGGSKPPGTT